MLGKALLGNDSKQERYLRKPQACAVSTGLAGSGQGVAEKNDVVRRWLSSIAPFNSHILGSVLSALVAKLSLLHMALHVN